MPAAVAALPQGQLEDLPFAVVANVAPVVADISAIMPDVAAVGAQIALVVADVTSLCSRGRIVAVSNIVAQLAAVLANIALVTADITPVLAPVNSVVPQVSPVAAQVAILAQRKRRSQHCKHHQTDNSSSHIASLVSGPYGLCDLEHRVAGKVLSACKQWKIDEFPRVSGCSWRLMRRKR